MRALSICRRIFAAAIAATVAGCALNPPPTSEELRKDALPHTEIPGGWRAGGGTAAPVADRWLATFDDLALTALVAEAQFYNTDLAIAAARVEQAAGYVAVASGALYPWVGFAGTYSGASGGGGGLNALFLNATLELDVWGRLRYASAAADAQSAAVQADYAYARQSIAATVAKSWFVAIEAGLQRRIIVEALRSSESLLNLAQERLRVGNGNEQAVAEARANTGGYRDMLRQIELSREQALRALELLVGRYPAAEIEVAQQLSPMPAAISVGVPSELLERRPDVIAAERRVAAAFNRIGEAKAARLPRISLTAGGSYITSDVLVLQDRSNPAFGFGANLIAPIYQGGTLRAQVEIRTAEQKEAVASYARTAQRSFAEVENALAAENALRDRDAILGANITDNARALELVQIQYRVGSVDLRTVQTSQIALYNARISLLRVQTERRAQRVNLYLALGGGFDAPAMEPVAAQAK
jgi:outer membrane protein, multidrug efflux system